MRISFPKKCRTICLCFCSFGDWVRDCFVQLCSFGSFVCCVRFALRLRFAAFRALLQAADCSSQNSDTSNRCNCSPEEANYSASLLKVKITPSEHTQYSPLQDRPHAHEGACGALDGAFAGSKEIRLWPGMSMEPQQLCTQCESADQGAAANTTPANWLLMISRGLIFEGSAFKQLCLASKDSLAGQET